ncbi:MAG TPA: hypothetical protein VIZ17_16480 [Acetobacteraceae bacterium]
MSRPVSSEDQDQTTVPDRRRPGRLRTDNPHLIALLRQPTSDETTPEAEAADKLTSRQTLIIEPDDEDDPLAAARGIARGAAVSALLWAIIGFCIWRLW